MSLTGISENPPWESLLPLTSDRVTEMAWKDVIWSSKTYIGLQLNSLYSVCAQLTDISGSLESLVFCSLIEIKPATELWRSLECSSFSAWAVGTNTQITRLVLEPHCMGHEGLWQRVLQLLYTKEFRKVRREFSNGLIASMPGSTCFSRSIPIHMYLKWSICDFNITWNDGNLHLQTQICFYM